MIFGGHARNIGVEFQETIVDLRVSLVALSKPVLWFQFLEPELKYIFRPIVWNQ